MAREEHRSLGKILSIQPDCTFLMAGAERRGGPTNLIGQEGMTMRIIKNLIPLVFAAGMAVGPLSAADVYVRVAPPHPLVERRVASPGHEYIWTPGYHRWDGRSYVWVPGAWVRPPRAHARWVGHHWVHRRGGWVLVEGHWR
jgi:hypothetical protein